MCGSSGTGSGSPPPRTCAASRCAPRWKTPCPPRSPGGPARPRSPTARHPRAPTRRCGAGEPVTTPRNCPSPGGLGRWSSPARSRTWSPRPSGPSPPLAARSAPRRGGRCGRGSPRTGWRHCWAGWPTPGRGRCSSICHPGWVWRWRCTCGFPTGARSLRPAGASASRARRPGPAPSRRRPLRAAGTCSTPRPRSPKESASHPARRPTRTGATSSAPPAYTTSPCSPGARTNPKPNNTPPPTPAAKSCPRRPVLRTRVSPAPGCTGRSSASSPARAATAPAPTRPSSTSPSRPVTSSGATTAAPNYPPSW